MNNNGQAVKRIFTPNYFPMLLYKVNIMLMYAMGVSMTDYRCRFVHMTVTSQGFLEACFGGKSPPPPPKRKI